MITTEKKLIKFNFTKNKNTPVYIVIHDTANLNKGADADAHFRYFNQADRKASAHLFVDDKRILQLIEFQDSAWHVGDGNGMYGISNNNSIGIEICINSDGNYESAFENTLNLTKDLMKTYSIPIEKVVRHYDASFKNCPGTMVKNNWEKWKLFKSKLAAKIAPIKTPIIQQPTEAFIMKGLVTSEKGLNIRKAPSLTSDILGNLPSNSSVEILSKEMNFYKIFSKNTVGYVSQDFVKITWTKPLNNNSQDVAQTYRVRKIWGDTQSQLGAFQSLESARNIVDKNIGYFVFDEKGNKIYSSSKVSS